MKVLILNTCDGYEAIYIDGKLIDEGETLGEGDSRLYLLKMSENYGFDSSDVEEKYLTDIDDIFVNDKGSFPFDLSSLKDKY